MGSCTWRMGEHWLSAAGGLWSESGWEEGCVPGVGSILNWNPPFPSKFLWREQPCRDWCLVF